MGLNVSFWHILPFINVVRQSFGDQDVAVITVNVEVIKNIIDDAPKATCVPSVL